MNLIERMSAPTPTFFKRLRNAGLVLTAVSGTIITSPVSLPAGVVQVVGYFAVAGAVASAVSQAATNNDEQPKDQINKKP